eukprot:2607296-Prymnesium_polylepis.1
MLRNGCCGCAWDPARVVRASSQLCHVRVPRPRSPLNTRHRLHTQRRHHAPGRVGRSRIPNPHHA